MFSVAATTANARSGTSSSARAPSAVRDAAPPAMSVFMSSSDSGGLSESPPES